MCCIPSWGYTASHALKPGPSSFHAEYTQQPVFWNDCGRNCATKSVARSTKTTLALCAATCWITMSEAFLFNWAVFKIVLSSSCREIKPYGRPYAKLTFLYLLLTVTHVCMAILTLCLRRRYASPLWSHMKCCCKTSKDKSTSVASGSLPASFKSAHPYGKPYGHLTNIS